MKKLVLIFCALWNLSAVAQDSKKLLEEARHLAEMGGHRHAHMKYLEYLSLVPNDTTALLEKASCGLSSNFTGFLQKWSMLQDTTRFNPALRDLEKLVKVGYTSALGERGRAYCYLASTLRTTDAKAYFEKGRNDLLTFSKTKKLDFNQEMALERAEEELTSKPKINR